MPRYLIERVLRRAEQEAMQNIGLRMKEVAEESFPDMTWEHSHVVSDESGIKTYCVYEAPNEERLQGHGDMVGRHTIAEHLRDRRRRDAGGFRTTSQPLPLRGSEDVADVGEGRVVDRPLQLDLPPPAHLILGNQRRAPGCRAPSPPPLAQPRPACSAAEIR